jgi:hypothetical protein
LALLSSLIIVGTADASTLLGSAVTGELYYYVSTGVVDTTMNFFDPAVDQDNYNGGTVPAGYGNANGPTTTVVDPGVEFGLLSGGGTVASPGLFSLTADLTDTTLTITKINSGTLSLAGFEAIFTDTAFTGLSVSKIEDTFAEGGIAAQLSGDTLTLSVAPNCVIGPGCTFPTGSETAAFSVTPVPLPATALLFFSGLGGLGALARKKRAAYAT